MYYLHVDVKEWLNQEIQENKAMDQSTQNNQI